MTELYDTVYPMKTPVVDGFLYGGTYLFVGAPKVGKSFFMAQLAYHVAKGEALWNYPVHQGTVLYLAPEDDYARLQKRLSQMFGVEGSDHLYFATRAKTVSEGLDRQLEGFMEEHPNASLIIIDTLQKVREVGGDRYSYASDYEIVTKLKAFSDKHNICLLVVHHTRKMESDDSFDMFSGTNGLLGAADGAFIMQKKKRTDNTAVMDIVGRMDNYYRLNITNSNLHRTNERLTRVNEKLKDENETLRAENKDYKLLRKVFGRKQIDNLLEQARETEQSKKRERFRKNQYER